MSSFKSTIWDYYQKFGRDLEWRKTNNPYHIFVSEIMLQQTQVARVQKKYPEFLTLFPSFQSLSKASLRDVLKVWQGMGYNRRAKYLKEAAHIIEEVYKGKVPRSIEKVDALPGIGYATACSILCFSYNTPTVFIETNIRRVFIHFFFKNREDIDDKEIFPLIEKTLDKDNPREWYYALMDYGAILGTQKENANTRSKHYVVQSPFEGSDRKIRGEIVRILLKEKKVSEKNLIAVINIEKDRFDRILNQLVKEKIVKKKDVYYFVK